VNALQRTADMMALGHYSNLTRKLYLQELRYLFQYYTDTRPSLLTYDMTVQYHFILHPRRLMSVFEKNN